MAQATLAVVLLASVVGMAVAFLVWLHRDRPGAGPLAAFVVAASLWTVAYGLELAVPDIGTMHRLLQIQLTLSVVIPIAWLVAVLEYTGHPHWLSRRRILFLLVEPAVFVTLVWSNPGHRLVWRGAETVVTAGSTTLEPAWGLASWGHQVYMLILVLAGGILLLQLMLRTNQLFRSQGLALLVVITIPMVGHSLYLFDVLAAPFNPTSLGYVISGIVLSAAILRGQLLDVAPVTRELGREAILAEMDDRVIIVDEAGRIVDINDAAADLFDSKPISLLGRLLQNELPDVAATMPGPDERAHTETRLERNGAVRYYDVRVTPLYRSYGTVSGHLISLRDMTEHRQREQRITVLNRLLRHDIRNEMNVVRGNADLLADHVEQDDHQRIDRILTTVDEVVDRSNKIGAVSEALENEEPRQLCLLDLIEPVVLEARERYPDAELTLDCPAGITVLSGPSLTLAFEELIDNAVEHTDGAVTVAVTVETASACVTVRVHDDGPGIAKHEREVILAGDETPLQHGSGVGLWLVKWVVRNAGGTLSFVDGEGTTVEIGLPRASVSEQE